MTMDSTVQFLLELNDKADSLLDTIDALCQTGYSWASVNEAAHSLGIKPMYVHELIRKGYLISVHGQSRTYIYWKSIDAVSESYPAVILLMQKGLYDE